MRPRILPLAFLLLPASAASACAGADAPPAPVTAEAAAPALETITEADLLAHIDTLASDAFEGRAPGTAGEEKTVAYLTGRFRALGLQPGNPDGGWTQDVTLVGIRNQATGSLRLRGGAKLRRQPLHERFQTIDAGLLRHQRVAQLGDGVFLKRQLGFQRFDLRIGHGCSEEGVLGELSPSRSGAGA